MKIYTIGHSSRSFENFVDLLKAHAIETLVDIRTLPGSMKFPHFNGENLKKYLPDEGIQYIWMKELGGLRHARQGFESPNAGLTNHGFRAYADYMLSEEFRGAVRRLIELASRAITAHMCAEAVYWRCHRRLLSDYLLANGVEVLHIQEKARLLSHKITDGVIVNEDGTIFYRSTDESQNELW
jgi:uncharacterized protein (DUF488 family)